MSVLSLLNPALGFRIIAQHHSLLLHLIKRTIGARYQGSVLGYFWSFAQPLMMLAVYTFVFGLIFKSRWGTDVDATTGSFAVVMFCGMSVYNIFSESVNSCCTLITNNTNYVKKVIFPLEIMPIAQVISTAILGMVWFLLVVLGCVLILGNIFWTMLLLPVTLIPLILFTTGISFFVASVGVYLRDLPYIVGIITQILFFMTPIFYSLQMVPEKYRWILYYNPLTFVVEQTREFFLFGRQPDWIGCGLMFVLSCVVFQLGLAWFVKTKKGFADVL